MSSLICEKRDIYMEVRALYQDWYSNEEKFGSCFYWAHAGWKVMTDHGFDVLFQAGSLSWPMVPREEWITNPITHFSYVWSPETPQSQTMLKAGKLPEIHVWLALPQRMELVDFSTGTLPTHAQANHELARWTGPKPPDFLWCRFADIPEGVFYDVNRDATKLLLRKIATDFLGP